MKNQRNKILSVTLWTALWQTLAVVAMVCATAAMALVSNELFSGSARAAELGSLLKEKHLIYFNWADHTSDLLTFLTAASGALVAIFVWMKSIKDVHKDHTEKLWRLAEVIQVGAAFILAINLSAIFHVLSTYEPALTPRLVLLVFFFLLNLLLTAEICSSIRIPLATMEKNYETALSHLQHEAATLQAARHPRHRPILLGWVGLAGRRRTLAVVCYLAAWMVVAIVLVALAAGLAKLMSLPLTPYVTTGVFVLLGIPVVAWLESIRFNVPRRGGIPLLVAVFAFPTLYTYALVGLDEGWVAAVSGLVLLVVILLVYLLMPALGARPNMQVLREVAVARRTELIRENLTVLNEGLSRPSAT